MESNMPILSVSEKGGTLCKKPGCLNLYQMYWRIFIKYNDEVDMHRKEKLLDVIPELKEVYEWAKS